MLDLSSFWKNISNLSIFIMAGGGVHPAGNPWSRSLKSFQHKIIHLMSENSKLSTCCSQYRDTRYPQPIKTYNMNCNTHALAENVRLCQKKKIHSSFHQRAKVAFFNQSVTFQGVESLNTERMKKDNTRYFANQNTPSTTVWGVLLSCPLVVSITEFPRNRLRKNLCNSWPMAMHNVYFVQYIFRATEVQTYPKNCVLVSYLTCMYIGHSLYKCAENIFFHIFVISKL